MGHLVGKAEVNNGSSRVSSANNSSSIGISKRLSYRDGSLCKSGILKYAHRAVPYHGLSRLDLVCEKLSSLISDIKTHPVGRNLVGVYDLDIDSGVDRKKKLLAKLLSLSHHLGAVLKLLIVNQRCAYLIALSLKEGVSHAAADDKSIALLEEV